LSARKREEGVEGNSDKKKEESENKLKIS